MPFSFFSPVRRALRRVRRRVGYTAINVAGLAIGLAACLIAGLYGWHAWSFDRYHPRADDVFRITTTVSQADGTRRSAESPRPLAPALEEEAAAVDAVARVVPSWPVISTDSLDVKRDDFFFADPSVFEIFRIPFVHGDAATALDAPGSVVLTASVARQYFGEGSPVGRTLRFRRSTDLTVTAVVEDPPDRTHWQYGLIARPPARDATWLELHAMTYARLAPGTTPDALQAQLGGLARRHTQRPDAGRTLEFGLQPLSDIHLYSDLKGEHAGQGVAGSLLRIGGIAFLLLLVAAINYVNLATAQARDRAREVGVRKTVGASQGQLVRQFGAEALGLAGVAGLLALLLAHAALPLFNQLAAPTLALGMLPGAGWVVYAAFVALVGLAAGSYPAFVLTRFRPAEVLKGNAGRTGPSRSVRQGLVAVQFGVAFVLLVGVVVVERQIDHMQSKSLGYDATQAVSLKAYGPMRDRAQTITQELRRHPTIRAAAAGSCAPGRSGEEALVRPDGASNTQPMRLCSADADFFSTLDIQLVQGRSFRVGESADRPSLIVNEAAVDVLGWTGSPLGRSLTWTLEDDIEDGTPAPRTGPVVGVVANFQPRSFRTRVPPMVFASDPELYQSFVVTTTGADFAETRDFLAAEWKRHVPQRNFEYTLLDQRVAALYESERDTARLVHLFAGIALLVACMGLVGLAAYTVEQRMQEIGVRKALGASVVSVVGLLSGQFARTVALACMAAVPVAYILARGWLGDFAYPFDLGPGVFLLAAAAALGTALLAVGTQAWRAARVDPAIVLRDG